MKSVSNVSPYSSFCPSFFSVAVKTALLWSKQCLDWFPQHKIKAFAIGSVQLGEDTWSKNIQKFITVIEKYSKINYRTRAIITRGLYIFYPIFHCGLYCRAVSVTEIYALNKEILQFLGLKSVVYNQERLIL